MEMNLLIAYIGIAIMVGLSGIAEKNQGERKTVRDINDTARGRLVVTVYKR